MLRYLKNDKQKQTTTMVTGSNYATEYNKLTDAEVYQLRRCNLIFF